MTRRGMESTPDARAGIGPTMRGPYARNRPAREAAPFTAGHGETTMRGPAPPRPAALRALVLFVLLVGIGARVALWNADFSFDAAESAIGLNVRERTLPQLLGPLAYEQGAPFGFLALEKAAVRTFGDTERALRLFPLLAGIASLFLFHHLARRIVGPWAGLVALALFAVSDKLVMYSAHAKQYTSDVAIGLALVLAVVDLEPAELTWPRAAMLGLAGAAAVVFSHSAIFVLAGIGLVLAFRGISERGRAALPSLALLGAVWLAAFVTLYLVSFRHLAASEYMQDYWKASFVPFPPRHLMDLHWYPEAFVRAWKNPGGMIYPGLAAFVSCVGIASLASRERYGLALLAAPFLPTLVASALAKYPFSDRLLLFLVPALILFLVEGVRWLWTAPVARGRFAAALLCAFLFYDPVVTENRDIFRRQPVEETRPVVQALARSFQPGDTIFVYSESLWSFLYYSGRFGLTPGKVVVGRSDESHWDLDVEDLQKVAGDPRVWFVFSDIDGGMARSSEENFFLFNLDRMGKRLDTHREPGSVLHLYDLSRAAAGPQP